MPATPTLLQNVCPGGVVRVVLAAGSDLYCYVLGHLYALGYLHFEVVLIFETIFIYEVVFVFKVTFICGHILIAIKCPRIFLSMVP